VDSTTGVQMAYVKKWAPALIQPVAVARCRAPLRPRSGGAGRCPLVAPTLGTFDLAYFDPPTTASLLTNYHVWETLVPGTRPNRTAVARKRIDSRDPPPVARSTPSGPCPTRCVRWCAVSTAALGPFVQRRGLVDVEELEALCGQGREVAPWPSTRLAMSGRALHLHPSGVKVGQVSHLSNHELL